MLIDFYELTMANSYFLQGKNELASFDLFFRKIPDNGGYAIMAGLEQVIQYIDELEFSKNETLYTLNKIHSYHLIFHPNHHPRH